MKSIPIKFRGKEAIKGGNYIYGDLVTREGGAAIRVRENHNLFDLHEYEVAVVPDSVAQLVGYDANGNEIYEGDKLIDIDEKDVVSAEIYPCVYLKYYRLLKEERKQLK